MTTVCDYLGKEAHCRNGKTYLAPELKTGTHIQSAMTASLRKLRTLIEEVVCSGSRPQRTNQGPTYPTASFLQFDFITTSTRASPVADSHLNIPNLFHRPGSNVDLHRDDGPNRHATGTPVLRLPHNYDFTLRFEYSHRKTSYKRKSRDF